MLRRIEVVKQSVQQQLSNEASSTDTSMDVDLEDEKDLTAAEKEMMGPVKSSRSKQVMIWLKRLSSNYVLVIAIIISLVAYFVIVVPIFLLSTERCSLPKGAYAIMVWVYNAYVIFVAITFLLTLIIDFCTYAKDLFCECGIRKTFVDEDPLVYRIEMIGGFIVSIGFLIPDFFMYALFPYTVARPYTMVLETCYDAGTIFFTPTISVIVCLYNDIQPWFLERAYRKRDKNVELDISKYTPEGPMILKLFAQKETMQLFRQYSSMLVQFNSNNCSQGICSRKCNVLGMLFEQAPNIPLFRRKFKNLEKSKQHETHAK